MLLRSSSTPILKSWISSQYFIQSYSYSPDHNTNNKEINFPKQLPRTKSTSILPHDLSKPVIHSLPDTQQRDESTRPAERDSNGTTPQQRLFSSSGLDEEVGGGGCGGDGGGGCGNGSNNYHGHGSVDAYYKNMIEGDPGNSLLLGNYAKFLMQVHGDLVKTEEYCERAILANPSDANMLSMYANIVWLTQRDSDRGQIYFDRALNFAPHDCYVLASYAKFLWDVEDEEEEDLEKKGIRKEEKIKLVYQSHLL